jgi:hypothetical protein
VPPQEVASSSVNSSSQSGDGEEQTGDSNVIKPCSLIWWLSDLPFFFALAQVCKFFGEGLQLGMFKK